MDLPGPAADKPVKAKKPSRNLAKKPSAAQSAPAKTTGAATAFWNRQGPPRPWSALTEYEVPAGAVQKAGTTGLVTQADGVARFRNHLPANMGLMAGIPEDAVPRTDGGPDTVSFDYGLLHRPLAGQAALVERPNRLDLQVLKGKLDPYKHFADMFVRYSQECGHDLDQEVHSGSGYGQQRQAAFFVCQSPDGEEAVSGAVLRLQLKDTTVVLRHRLVGTPRSVKASIQRLKMNWTVTHLCLMMDRQSRASNACPSGAYSTDSTYNRFCTYGIQIAMVPFQHPFDLDQTYLAQTGTFYSRRDAQNWDVAQFEKDFLENLSRKQKDFLGSVYTWQISLQDGSVDTLYEDHELYRRLAGRFGQLFRHTVGAWSFQSVGVNPTCIGATTSGVTAVRPTDGSAG